MYSFSIRHLFKGAFYYGFGDSFVALIRFGLILVYTRYLLPAEFGVYAIIQTSILLSVIIVPIGLASAIFIKFRDDNPIKMIEDKNTAFFVLLINCVLLSIFLGLYVILSGSEHIIKDIYPLLVLWGSSRVLSLVPSVSLRYKEKILQYSFTKVFGTVIMSMCLIVFYFTGKIDLFGIIVSETIGSVAEFLLVIILDKYRPSLPKMSEIKSLIRIGLPLCMISFGVYLIDLSDRYVLYNFIGKEAVGYYSAAVKISLIAMFITEAFNSMWTPYYYKIAVEKRNLTNSYFGVSKKLVLYFGLIFALAIIVLPKVVDVNIFDIDFIPSEYRVVKKIIAPLSLIAFFKMFFYLLTPVITLTQKNWSLVKIVFVGAFINIVGNILLVKLLNVSLMDMLFLISLMTSFSYFVCGIMGFNKVSGILILREYKINSKIGKGLIYNLVVVAILLISVLMVEEYYKVLIVVMSLGVYLVVSYKRDTNSVSSILL